MRNRALLSAIALAVMIFSLVVRAQNTAPSRAPAGPPPGATSKVADLSGDWAPDPKRGGIGQSLSLSDNGGRQRGNETDIPYLPWAREKTLSERSSTGPDLGFASTTDPQVLYCEPPGVPHIYLWPIKTKLVQTTEAVYILHEYGPFFRVVWLNSKHPEDPDPQWWGHSIGWYENDKMIRRPPIRPLAGVPRRRFGDGLSLLPVDFAGLRERDGLGGASRAPRPGGERHARSL